MREPAEVADLCDQRDGGEEVDSSQRRQGRHDGPHAPPLALAAQCFGQALHTLMCLDNRLPIFGPLSPNSSHDTDPPGQAMMSNLAAAFVTSARAIHRRIRLACSSPLHVESAALILTRHIDTNGEKEGGSESKAELTTQESSLEQFRSEAAASERRQNEPVQVGARTETQRSGSAPQGIERADFTAPKGLTGR